MTQTTAYDIADQFLKSLGAPSTPDMRRAVTIWLRWESGNTVTGGNAWNLHVGSACNSATGFCPIDNSSMAGLVGNRYAGSGDKNVGVFSNVNYGTAAAAQNLLNLKSQYGYGAVISQAQSGNAVGFLTALQNSGWSAGHYGHSKLVADFNSGGGKNYTVNLLQPTGASSTPNNPVTSGTTPTATQTDFQVPNPLDAVAGVGTAIQETGVWLGIFFLGMVLLLGGIFLLAKGPAESTAQTVGPIAAAAAV